MRKGHPSRGKTSEKIWRFLAECVQGTTRRPAWLEPRNRWQDWKKVFLKGRWQPIREDFVGHDRNSLNLQSKGRLSSNILIFANLTGEKTLPHLKFLLNYE